MKRLRQIAALVATLTALSGCELIASFDRSRITEDLPDVGVLFSGDGAVLGGDGDSAVRDAGLFDGATTPPDEDAGEEDAGDDAGTDAGEPEPDAGELDGGELDGGDDSDAGDGSVAPGDADVTDGAVDPDAAG